MITLHSVSSLEFPGLATYRTLRLTEEHIKAGVFVAEGGKVVQRLLESDIEVSSALLTPRWWSELEELFRARRENIDIYIAEHTLLEGVIGVHVHQGVMAIGHIRSDRALDEALAGTTSPRLLVALDGLTNAENVGIVLRNCAAFGVELVIIGETAATCWLRRAVRSSMGSVFKLPVHHSRNLVATIKELQLRGVAVFGTTPHTQYPLDEADLTRDCCIVLGHEGDGIRPDVLGACDQPLAIPMSDGVDSLNVANAAAVFLYEVRRQQHRAKPGNTS